LRPGITIDVRRVLLAMPLVPQPGFERITGAIQKHARGVLGVDVPTTGSTPGQARSRLFRDHALAQREQKPYRIDCPHGREQNYAGKQKPVAIRRHVRRAVPEPADDAQRDEDCGKHEE
jgi:hypothetical protein